VRTGIPSACATVNCKVCKSAIAPYCLYLRMTAKEGVNESNHPILNPLISSRAVFSDPPMDSPEIRFSGSLLTFFRTL
jgi:hypothetical protein